MGEDFRPLWGRPACGSRWACQSTPAAKPALSRVCPVSGRRGMDGPRARWCSPGRWLVVESSQTRRGNGSSRCCRSTGRGGGGGITGRSSTRSCGSCAPGPRGGTCPNVTDSGRPYTNACGAGRWVGLGRRSSRKPWSRTTRWARSNGSSRLIPPWSGLISMLLVLGKKGLL